MHQSVHERVDAAAGTVSRVLCEVERQQATSFPFTPHKKKQLQPTTMHCARGLVCKRKQRGIVPWKADCCRQCFSLELRPLVFAVVDVDGLVVGGAGIWGYWCWWRCS